MYVCICTYIDTQGPFHIIGPASYSLNYSILSTLHLQNIVQTVNKVEIILVVLGKTKSAMMGKEQDAMGRPRRYIREGNPLREQDLKSDS